MGFGRKIRRGAKKKTRLGSPQRTPVYPIAVPSQVAIAVNEVSREPAFREHARKSQEALVDFLVAQKNPVLWVIGPGRPPIRLRSLLESVVRHPARSPKSEPLEIHVVDPSPQVAAAIKHAFDDLPVRFAFHPGRFPAVHPPGFAHAVLVEHVSQFLDPHEQKPAAEKIASALHPGGRVHYTYVDPPYEAPMAPLNDSVGFAHVTYGSKPFHQALCRRLHVLSEEPVPNRLRTYVVVEKKT